MVKGPIRMALVFFLPGSGGAAVWNEPEASAEFRLWWDGKVGLEIAAMAVVRAR